MKKFLSIIVLFFTIHCQSQSVFGYWYGYANVKSNTFLNNYLVELILQPDKGFVKGVLNYYFKNTFRSLPVKGNYNAATRQLSLYEIPMTYNGSLMNLEVDCIMNMEAKLRVAKAGSNLSGSLISLPAYKNICADIVFNLKLNTEISNEDSVLNAIKEFKETKQFWQPSSFDTLVAAKIIQRKVVNYVIEREYKERTNVVAKEIEVESDSLKVDFYDNGEIDGDSISVFFNNQLLAFHQFISTKAVHFDIVLDSSQAINEMTVFADNLGSIPPNTALMVVNDGVNRIDVPLASDMKTNATVRIKRKKKSQ